MMKWLLTLVLVLSFFNGNAQKKNQAKCYDLDQVLKVVPTDLYKSHLEASKGFKVKILENTGTVQKYIDKGKLQSVNKKMKGYKIQKLEYSRPYLTYKAKLTLENMASRFFKKTDGSHFTVSSITRTLEDQCRLRKVNTNASLGVSSHNYGNSFDISYVRFDGVLKVNSKLEKKLEEVLSHYQKLGRIYYIKEMQQSCYHVTVRNY